MEQTLEAGCVLDIEPADFSKDDEDKFRQGLADTMEIPKKDGKITHAARCIDLQQSLVNS